MGFAALHQSYDAPLGREAIHLVACLPQSVACLPASSAPAPVRQPAISHACPAIHHLIVQPLNHTAVSPTYRRGLGKRRFPMTKHRRITGFVAVVLAVAATAATVRALPSKHHPNASPGIMSLTDLKVDVNKLATDAYDEPIICLFSEAQLAACAGCAARHH